MGTWGTAIFSDDTASDVRDEYRDLIGEGLSTEQATDKLLRHYAPSLDDPDDGPPFWLGLAVTQWKCGRLLEQVKEKALHIIDSGADLKRWSGDAKRRAVLEKTRAQLLSPQPRPTRIRKRYFPHHRMTAISTEPFDYLSFPLRFPFMCAGRSHRRSVANLANTLRPFRLEAREFLARVRSLLVVASEQDDEVARVLHGRVHCLDETRSQPNVVGSPSR